ncbi:STAS domain-containing protein [Jatrophihabitans cynanchi]|jgi:anti-anti-sigma regulatory factor|uniref:STAS domain-containing protein n=1 Tax=Jatrophihabitans cynanchi TaxID=2944128 RepID=A0ABY7JYT4_9ACTN|nr:STAS domain-containing protein [Jatrophihabitans sp. SB3-54]WAX56477.1 STAS domain-containing protein [Jatrophihabitans sp. SB3-54]
MSNALIDPTARAGGDSAGRFDVVTTTYDRFRAALRVRGGLDATSAPVLAEVIAGHLRAGRRFVRVDVLGARVCDPGAAMMLLEAHRTLLAARGTLILTGVTRALHRALELAGLAQDLFIVPACAHEQVNSQHRDEVGSPSFGGTPSA